MVVSGRPGGASGDMQWDYSLAYSWMIGRELADPFYSSKPDRYAPWGHARVVVLFPNMCAHPPNRPPAAAWPGLEASKSAALRGRFAPEGWTDPPVFSEQNGTLQEPGDVRSSVILKHFVAYVLGAANVVDRINNTINTVLPP